MKKRMNKKGITEVMLTLIISGMAVGMLFLGTFLTYNQFAEDLGIDFEEASLIQKPSYSTPSKIEIINVDQDDMNLTMCELECDRISNAADKTECKDTCVAEGRYTDPDANYSRWTIDFRYAGSTPSEVTLNMIEEGNRSGNNFIGYIVQNSTGYIMTYGATNRMVVISKKDETCNGNITINLSATQDANAVTFYEDTEQPFFESYPFCVSPPAEDINASINSIQFDPAINSFFTNASITGSKVIDFCPLANMIMVITNTSGVENIPINTSGLECSFSIDTDNANGPFGWYNEDWKYRIRINVTNDAGEDITWEETAVVRVDLSDTTLGYDVNITDCEDEIVITKASAGGGYKTERNITSQTMSDGYCVGADIEFVVHGETETFSDGTSQIFYVYFGNPDATETNDDVSIYYPKYTFTDFDATGYSAVNTTVANSDVHLKETVCAGAT